MTRIKAGHKVKTHGSTKYRRYEEERKNLQKNYERGDIPEDLFLKMIGAKSMKTVHQGTQFVYNDGQAPPPLGNVDDEEGSDDSLSETRQLNVTSSDDSDSGLQPSGTRSAALQPSKSKAPVKSKPKCLRCSKGFQMWRNLHVSCQVCKDSFHKRCILAGDRYDGDQSFTCSKCSPVQSQDITGVVSISALVEAAHADEPATATETPGQSSKCSVCSRGFRNRSNVPTFLWCRTCEARVHKKCVKSTSYICKKCEEVQQLRPSSARQLEEEQDEEAGDGEPQDTEDVEQDAGESGGEIPEGGRNGAHQVSEVQWQSSSSVPLLEEQSPSQVQQLRPSSSSVRLLEDAELLLTGQVTLEEVVPVELSAPPPTKPPTKPSFTDHMSLLESKLEAIGFKTSQLTPADGDCLIHGRSYVSI